jgi:hypothetical protein
MNKALAFYFGIIAVYDAFGLNWSNASTVVYALPLLVVWLALALGLYRRYRFARVAAVGVCVMLVGVCIVSWFTAGFPYFILIGGALFGLPLVGLLHPRARTEFARPLRTASTRQPEK